MDPRHQALVRQEVDVAADRQLADSQFRRDLPHRDGAVGPQFLHQPFPALEREERLSGCFMRLVGTHAVASTVRVNAPAALGFSGRPRGGQAEAQARQLRSPDVGEEGIVQQPFVNEDDGGGRLPAQNGSAGCPGGGDAGGQDHGCPMPHSDGAGGKVGDVDVGRSAFRRIAQVPAVRDLDLPGFPVQRCRADPLVRAQAVGCPERQPDRGIPRLRGMQHLGGKLGAGALLQAKGGRNAVPAALHGTDLIAVRAEGLGRIGGLAGVNQKRYAVNGHHHRAHVPVVVVLAVVSALGCQEQAFRVSCLLARHHDLH
jgi:hypothetical protein